MAASKAASRASVQPDSRIVRRDTPWLFPSNRKLRNLGAISLRNLSLTPAGPSRPRGKTIDDDAVPHALQSPAKLVALREQKALGYSRSSSDLRSVHETAVVHDSDSDAPSVRAANGSPVKHKLASENGSPRTPVSRPAMMMMRGRRRRSTLDWASGTPQRRQEKLESVAAERMADVFFSLHVHGVEEPIYVSETVERTMNPTFTPVDLSVCGPGITRLDSLTVRFWVHSARMAQWRQLLKLSVSLTRLQYLGKSLDQPHRTLPPNAVVFHLTDGVYTCFHSFSDYVPPPVVPTPAPRTASTRTLSTASFDALLRLSKLDDSIQDALATRDKIAADLEVLLERNKSALTAHDRVLEAEDRLKTIDYAKKTVEKQREKARRQQDEKKTSLQNRREHMRADRASRSQAAEHMQQAGPSELLAGLRDEHTVKVKAIQDQRRRICEDVQKCYPIRPIPQQSLAFTIRDLHLPNSEELDAEPADTVAAAFGYIAHMLLLLSFYLSHPLPYPLTPRGSTSTIEDPISLLKTNASVTQTYKDEHSLRTYPLFAKGVPRFCFEYGVFLLNKDVQILLESAYHVRVLDVRQTLPNLKYLLYVATAGEGELPARKAGGIRGLLRTTAANKTWSEEGTPILSRAGSADSTASSAFSGLLWHSGGVGGREDANGKPRGAVQALRRNIGGKKGG